MIQYTCLLLLGSAQLFFLLSENENVDIKFNGHGEFLE
jgi:hypothetical protein